MASSDLPGAVNVHDDAFIEQVEMHLSNSPKGRYSSANQNNDNSKPGPNEEGMNIVDSDEEDEEVITQKTLSILDEMTQNNNNAANSTDTNDNNNNNNSNAYESVPEATASPQTQSFPPRDNTMESTNLDAIATSAGAARGKTATAAATIQEEEEEVVTTGTGYTVGAGAQNEANEANERKDGMIDDMNDDFGQERKERDDVAPEDLGDRQLTGKKFGEGLEVSVAMSNIASEAEEKRAAAWAEYCSQAYQNSNAKPGLWDLCCGGCHCC